MDMRPRAVRYAVSRQGNELERARDELALAGRQAESGGLAARIIAAYSQAADAEADARAWGAS